MSDDPPTFPFQLVRHAQNIARYLSPSETITCVGGSASDIFFGSSNGRIAQFEFKNNVLAHVGSVQMAVQSPITTIACAPAVGIVFVVCNCTLIELSLDTLESLGQRSGISSIALNCNPTVDNPFVLEFAVATTSKTIQVCQKRELRNENITKISTNGFVNCLQYSGDSLCFECNGQYNIFNITMKTVVPLFTIDLRTQKPFACVLSRDEYLLCGMEGLLVFASSEGVSNRPPQMLPTHPLKGLAHTSPFILALGNDKILIYRYQLSDSQGQEPSSLHFSSHEQELSMENARFLANVDDTLFVVTNAEVYHVRHRSLKDRVHTFIEDGEISKAVDFLSEELSDISVVNKIDSNDAALLGFHAMCEGKFEFAERVFLENSKFDPCEVIALYPWLHSKCKHTFGLPLLDQVVSESSNSPSEQDFNRFLTRLLEEYRAVSATSSKIVDTNFLKLMILSGKDPFCAVAANLSIDWGEVEEFCIAHQMIHLTARIAFSNGNQQKAFSIWKDLESRKLTDATYNQKTVFEALHKVKDEKIFLDALKWLIHAPDDEIKLLLENPPVSSDRIVPLLEPNETILIWFLHKVRRQGERKWDMKLAFHYISQLNGLKHSGGDNVGVRQALREILLTSENLDRSKVFVELQGVEHFSAELDLLNAQKAPKETLQKLVKKNDFDAAELLCTTLGGANPELGPLLLKAYLGDKDKIVENGERLGRLLNELPDCLQPTEILEQLPDNMTLSDVESFLLRCISTNRQKVETIRLKAAAGCRMINNPPLPLLKNQREIRNSVRLEEDSRCPACDSILSLEDQLCLLPTGYVVHSRCIRHPTLCPVTKEVLYKEREA